MDANRKPRDDEVDVFGLTHQGKVRKDNQDQFLIGSVYRRVMITQTSLTELDRIPLGDERVAFLAMVADGVGGGVGGQRASATALEVATEYVTSTSDCVLNANVGEQEFTEALRAAALRSHEAVRARAAVEAGGRSMATTLTLWISLWPWYYLLQVGDSRYYRYRDGELTQVSRDQTIAQDLVDKGVLSQAAADRSRLSDVLSSAIGADEALPTVTRMRSDWGNVHLLCTDGLTKHVTDARIKEVLAAMTSSKQAAELLLQEALDGGGTDNVTIIVGRAVAKPE
jgi:protein phosphatase